VRRVKAASLSSILLSRSVLLKEATSKPGDISAELALRPEHPLALHARIAEEFSSPAGDPAAEPAAWLDKARALFARPPARPDEPV
jgi:hypothetical protein